MIDFDKSNSAYAALSVNILMRAYKQVSRLTFVYLPSQQGLYILFMVKTSIIGNYINYSFLFNLVSFKLDIKKLSYGRYPDCKNTSRI